LFIPPNLKHNLANTPYRTANLRLELIKAGLKYNSAPEVAELTATYYAMVEEVDAWLGLFFNKLKIKGIEDNTLVIFTSDHGEMLGTRIFCSGALMCW